jgi:hypothetical protein
MEWDLPVEYAPTNQFVEGILGVHILSQFQETSGGIEQGSSDPGSAQAGRSGSLYPFG